MTAQRAVPSPASPSPGSRPSDGKSTLKLASYQKPDRRSVEERRTEPLRAAVGERRTTTQRVLRALFGT